MEKNNKKSLPYIALGLDFLSVALFIAASFVRGMSSALLMLAILAPVAAIVTGVAALSAGKGRIHIAGKIVAIVAVALPLSFVAFILIFFAGAAMGVVSLM